MSDEMAAEIKAKRLRKIAHETLGVGWSRTGAFVHDPRGLSMGEVVVGGLLGGMKTERVEAFLEALSRALVDGAYRAILVFEVSLGVDPATGQNRVHRCSVLERNPNNPI